MEPASSACPVRARPASPCSTAKTRAMPPRLPFPPAGGIWRPICARTPAMTGRPILTAAAMRAAEQAAIDGGASVETLMERAGEALAEAIFQYAGNQPVLFACGPGNNGGDGYVPARPLRKRGVGVRG